MPKSAASLHHPGLDARPEGYSVVCVTSEDSFWLAVGLAILRCGGRSGMGFPPQPGAPHLHAWDLRCISSHCVSLRKLIASSSTQFIVGLSPSFDISGICRGGKMPVIQSGSAWAQQAWREGGREGSTG
jgi:hypothetical protein